MQSSWRNSAIAIFITAIFLSPLLTSSVHALDHLSFEDDSIPCEQCDVLAQSNELDFLNTSNGFTKVEAAIVPSSFIVTAHYEISKETFVLPSFLYNKPPPLFKK